VGRGGAERVVKVLVMGGTQFNGLALVRELVRTGHDVSICNRGKTAAELPRSVSRLTADRTDPGQLRAALAGRDWDCVFDISAYRPEDARLMSELLRGRTGHYVFASSTVIYAPTDLLPITEDHPLDTSERQNDYGRNKILCEEILLREHRERGFPATVAAFSIPTTSSPTASSACSCGSRAGARC
jgi:nucleoside-diphosphate-sugar epimerase